MNRYLIIIGAFNTEEGAKVYAKKLEKDGYPSFIIEQVLSGEIKPVEPPKKARKTTKELYNEVMKLGLNGEERKKYLGNRHQEVQDYINKRH